MESLVTPQIVSYITLFFCIVSVRLNRIIVVVDLVFSTIDFCFCRFIGINGVALLNCATEDDGLGRLLAGPVRRLLEVVSDYFIMGKQN